jgi:hypothetical protein
LTNTSVSRRPPREDDEDEVEDDEDEDGDDGMGIMPEGELATEETEQADYFSPETVKEELEHYFAEQDILEIESYDQAEAGPSTDRIGGGEFSDEGEGEGEGSNTGSDDLVRVIGVGRRENGVWRVAQGLDGEPGEVEAQFELEDDEEFEGLDGGDWDVPFELDEEEMDLEHELEHDGDRNPFDGDPPRELAVQPADRDNGGGLALDIAAQDAEAEDGDLEGVLEGKQTAFCIGTET